MKLYHSSYLKLSILNPTLGNDRHDGEDPRAINQPVVYFTTAEDETFRAKGEEAVAPYKYIVEIDENDPDLYLDEKHHEFLQEIYDAFGDCEDTKWYFYKKSIRISETLEWDGQRYINRPNF